MSSTPPGEVVDRLTINLRKAKRSDFVRNGEMLYGVPYFTKTYDGRYAMNILRSHPAQRNYFKTLYAAGKILVTDDDILCYPRYV